MALAHQSFTLQAETAGEFITTTGLPEAGLLPMMVLGAFAKDEQQLVTAFITSYNHLLDNGLDIAHHALVTRRVNERMINSQGEVFLQTQQGALQHIPPEITKILIELNELEWLMIRECLSLVSFRDLDFARKIRFIALKDQHPGWLNPALFASWLNLSPAKRGQICTQSNNLRYGDAVWEQENVIREWHSSGHKGVGFDQMQFGRAIAAEAGKIIHTLISRHKLHQHQQDMWAELLKLPDVYSNVKDSVDLDLHSLIDNNLNHPISRAYAFTLEVFTAAISKILEVRFTRKFAAVGEFESPDAVALLDKLDHTWNLQLTELIGQLPKSVLNDLTINLNSLVYGAEEVDITWVFDYRPQEPDPTITSQYYQLIKSWVDINLRLPVLRLTSDLVNMSRILNREHIGILNSLSYVEAFYEFSLAKSQDSNARIDVLLRTNNGLVIIDHKNMLMPNKKPDKRHLDQLAGYLQQLADFFPGESIDKIYIFELSLPGMRLVDVTKQVLARIEQ